MRINARLEPALAKKFAYLKAKRGGTTSGVLKEAIQAFYERETVADISPLERLERAGLVGFCPGPPNLSTGYKGALTKSLGRKLRGHRR